MKCTTIAELQACGREALRTMLQQVNLHYMYHQYLEQGHEAGEPARIPGVHASEVASCQREVVYCLYCTEKKKRTTAEMKKRFVVGSAIHDMLQTHFEDMARISNGRFTFVREAAVDDTDIAKRYMINSHSDGIFTFFDRGEPVLRICLEIKSSSPAEFAKLNKPQDKHIKQAHIYMACLDLPLTWYLYWNKGNQNITPSILGGFLETFDPNVWAGMLSRIKNCLDMAERQELPDREEGFHCSWCPYSWTCQPSSVKTNYRSNEPTEHRPISK